MTYRPIWIIAAIPLCLLSTTLPAQTEPVAQPVPPEDAASEFRFSVGGGYEYDFNSSLEDGGEVAVSRFTFGLGVGKKLSDELDMSLRFNYDLDAYDFDTPNGLAATDPWGDIHTMGFGAIFTYTLDDHWAVFGGPVFQFSRESGADWSDSLIGGGVIGAMYSFSKDLTVGGGLGVTTQIEDDVRIFPILILNWNITESLKLASQTSGASGRTGVELVWTCQKWEFAFGGASDFSRFRLDGDGVAPDGVGQDESIPIWLRVGYRFNDNIAIDLLGGLNCFETLRLEDSSGSKISDQDVDTTFFAGVFLKLRF